MGVFDFLWGKKIPKSGFVEEYEGLFEKKIPAVRPIDQLTFVVLDTETTGLNHKKDSIVSFGGIKVKGYSMQIQSAKEMYLEVQVQNNDAVKVHEIIQANEIVPKKDFAKELLAFVGADIIVGQHIGFDMLMLEKELQAYGLKKLLNPVVDTQFLAIRLEKGPHFDASMGKPGEFGLDSLCERYGIPLDDRHTAAGDAFLTAQLLMKLLKLAEQKGIKDYGALTRSF